MTDFLVRKVHGWWLVAVTIASIGYGQLILKILPHWHRLEIVQGGSDLQERYFYSAATAQEALGRVAAQAPHDAFAFYLLDLPNAFLFGPSVAALVGWGLRLNGLANGGWRFLVYLPILSSLLDWSENALLLSALSAQGVLPSAGLTALGAITGMKLATGNASLLIAIALIIVGLVRKAFRK